jgi:hypothetical protein
LAAAGAFVFPCMLRLCWWLATTFVELPPGSEALSEFRLEYWDKFSAKLDLLMERAKPDGPAVNWAYS